METNWSSSATNLDLHWTEFINNYRSIYGPVTSSGGGVTARQNINVLPITACDFIGTGYLLSDMIELPVSYPKTGVEVHQWPLLTLTVGPVNNSSGLAHNTFTDLQNGVACIRSSVAIFGALFNGIENSSGLGSAVRALWSDVQIKAGPGGSGNSNISNSDRGVFGFFSDVEVDDIDFDNVDGAVHAIMLRSGGLDITNSDIDYNQFGIQVSGSGRVLRTIAGNTFTSDGLASPDQSDVAVEILNTRITGRYRLLEVFENTFDLENEITAIHLQNCQKVRVYENQFDITRPDVGSARPNTGILVEASDEFTIFNCNRVTVYDDDEGDLAVSAINSPMVYYDCFREGSSARNGFQVMGVNIGADLLTNDIDGSVYDLIYGSSEGFAEPLVGNQIYHGNCFTKTVGSNDEAIHHGSNPFTAIINTFVVNDNGNGQGTKYYPDFIAPIQDWFDPENQSTNEMCNLEGNYCSRSIDAPGEKFENKIPSALDTLLIEGKDPDGEPILQTQDSSAYAWTGKRHIYRFLKDADTDSLDQYYINFLNGDENTTIGKFDEVEKLIQEMFELTQIRQDTLDALYVQRAELIDSLNSKFENYVDTLSEIDSFDNTLFSSYITSTNAKRGKIDSILNEIDEEIIGEYVPNAKEKNNAITTSETYELNEKVYNSILLRFLEVGADTLSTADIDSLEDISDQCFVAGGDAIFKAQALLDALDGPRQFSNDTLCHPVQQLRVPADFSIIDEIRVYPNPTNQELVLEIPKEHRGKQVKIAIFSTGGILVESYTISLETQTMLPLGILRNGFYFARIQDGSEVIGQFKFVKNDAN